MANPKTLLISGGSSGLGAAVIRYFLEHDWRVIVLSRDKSSVQTHPNLVTLTCEHSTKGIDQVYEQLETYLQEGLDLLINNAGFALVGALESLDASDIYQQLETNLVSHIYLSKKCIPFLRRARGKIFNISSLFGMMGCPLHSIYCASKYAIEGFSESLHFELKPQQIQCCCIVPGRHHTRFGANMKIVDMQAPEQKIYQGLYQGFLNLKQMLTSKKANDPEQYAAKLYKLSLKNKLPPRIAVNPDSYLPYIIRKIYPDRLYHWGQNMLYSKHFYQGQSS